MFFYDISVWPVIGAAAAAMALGFVWYSPWLFGKKWLAEMGITAEKMEEHKKKGQWSMVRPYLISTILAFVTAFVVAALLNSLIVVGVGNLLLTAFLLWLAFSMPVGVGDVIYGGRSSFALFAINSGYNLASIILAAFIIGIFG